MKDGPKALLLRAHSVDSLASLFRLGRGKTSTTEQPEQTQGSSGELRTDRGPLDRENHRLPGRWAVPEDDPG